ncbi:MAG: RT0821/Lpp0805 family surface protein [Alphaproteobacteria bacterium]
MNSFKIIAATMVVAVGASACTGPSRSTIGGLAGGVAGAALGSQFGSGTGRLVAVAGGTLLGALIGSSIGAYMDEQDQLLAQQAQTQAFAAQPGQTVAWTNPDNGNRGTVQTLPASTSYAGRYCRDYVQTVFIDGRQETLRGTACQNPDGTWEAVS